MSCAGSAYIDRMARLRMYIHPDQVRFVLPSKLGRLALIAAVLFTGLGLIPAIATVTVGLAWAAPWSLLALIFAQPLIGSLRALARPQIEVEVGLHRLVVRRAWLGFRFAGLTAPWDQLDDAHLCAASPRAHGPPDEPVELIVVDHRGAWVATGARGSMPEMAPLLAWIREQIQRRSQGPVDRGQADLRRLAAILGRARTPHAIAAPRSAQGSGFVPAASSINRSS